MFHFSEIILLWEDEVGASRNPLRDGNQNLYTKQINSSLRMDEHPKAVRDTMYLCATIDTKLTSLHYINS